MASSTTKKAVIRRFQKEPLAGYVNPASYLQPAGVDLLSAAGNVSTVPYADIKTISFVRDFEDAGQAGRRVFNTRPKISGVWVRMHFRDGELMDGILANNLLQLEPYGFTVVPPNPSSSNQRVFVPRAALAALQVLGVVGSPLRPQKSKPKPKQQIELFE